MTEPLLRLVEGTTSRGPHLNLELRRTACSDRFRALTEYRETTSNQRELLLCVEAESGVRQECRVGLPSFYRHLEIYGLKGRLYDRRHIVNYVHDAAVPETVVRVYVPNARMHASRACGVGLRRYSP